jgi:hypothetical protein
MSTMGVRWVCQHLGLSERAPYEWVAGRHPPSPRIAVQIVRLSEGRVTFSDIYNPMVPPASCSSPTGEIEKPEVDP